MPEPKVLTEEEIANILGCSDDDAYACARRIEAAVLVKRDAQLREAANSECICERVDSEVGEDCPACRTVSLQTGPGEPALDILNAVSVTEALLREQRERWGHVAGCACCVIKSHPHHDNRCAPQEEKAP